MWVVILLVWGLVLTQSWQFETDRLVIKRVLLPDRSIPYEAITSVDWTSRHDISLTLGGLPVFRATEKRAVMVRDMRGFLSEMEHHVQPDVLHI